MNVSWKTQPICGSCWQAYSYGKFGEVRLPAQIVEKERTKDVCCTCGAEASQGIYIRADAEKVPFPQPA